jgi:hypothetical protein
MGWVGGKWRDSVLERAGPPALSLASHVSKAAEDCRSPRPSGGVSLWPRRPGAQDDPRYFSNHLVGTARRVVRK